MNNSDYNRYLSEVIRNQLNLLFENENTEGLVFGGRGRNSDGKFRFTPGKYDTTTDTRIFDEQGKEMVRQVLLPKSGVMSYNLYKVGTADVSKALKHPETLNGKIDQDSINKFMARTALYIKHLLKNTEIDYFTTPQSSSQFNRDMINQLLRLYPKSDGFKFIPDMLTKNVRKIYINTEVAKKLGLTDKEIYALQQRVDKWKSDEDLRELRRKIRDLEEKVLQAKKNRGRGRPSKEFTNNVSMLSAYKDQVKDYRKGKMGRDSTIDKEGNIKDFQIKSIDDRERRAIEGLFEINPALNGIQQKLRGKTVLVFDDNISSGATLDDICLVLKRLGVKQVIPITLAVIPKTIYGAHERLT